MQSYLGFKTIIKQCDRNFQSIIEIPTVRRSTKMKASKHEETDDDSSDVEDESESEEKPSASFPSKAPKRSNPFFNTG